MNLTDLKRSVFQIKDAAGKIHGTGFVINNEVAVTCAHVVIAAGAQPGELVAVTFGETGEPHQLPVIPEAWRSAEDEDIAILQLANGLPQGVVCVSIGSSEDSGNHKFSAFGFPKVGDFLGVWAKGDILGVIENSQGIRVLQISSQEIIPGMSGAPIFDTDLQRVVGMVNSIYNPGNCQER